MRYGGGLFIEGVLHSVEAVDGAYPGLRLRIEIGGGYWREVMAWRETTPPVGAQIARGELGAHRVGEWVRVRVYEKVARHGGKGTVFWNALEVEFPARPEWMEPLVAVAGELAARWGQGEGAGAAD